MTCFGFPLVAVAIDWSVFRAGTSQNLHQAVGVSKQHDRSALTVERPIADATV